MNNIKIGDKIKVMISEDFGLWATVEYIPVATGDSWILIDDTGDTYYVQSFMFLFKPKPLGSDE